MIRPEKLAALAFVPAFALSLAACAPETAPVASAPTPSASESASAPEPTKPGSRLPADCARVFKPLRMG